MLSILEQTLIYTIMGLGVYISYKILNFPDLTVDGSFPFGAAVTAVLITKGIDPVLCLIISTLLGALAGGITGIIHVKFKITELLSGIIVMTALYTVNLRVAGVSNVPIFGARTLFENDLVASLGEGVRPYTTLIIMLIIVLVVKILLDLYFKTKSGFLLRAVGDNPTLLSSLAKDPGKVKIMGLMIANGLVALSGSVLCQYQRFFEITMGTGKMIMGLAGVIIGVSLLSVVVKIKDTTKVFVGMFVYQAAIFVAILVGLQSSDLKLITALIFFVALIINKNNFFVRRKKND